MKAISIKAALCASLFALFIAGCSNDDTGENTNSALDGQSGEGQDTHVQSEGNEDAENSDVGFELNEAGEVDEAENVPADEEKAILETFDQYISTFNDKDIDGYMNLLLTGGEYFNEQEERAALEDVFNNFDVKREVELKTINKYEKDQAQVYSDLQLTTTDPANGAEAKRTGRQITVMKKTDGEWKIASIHFMANPA
ncbi:nuclear transport factor 2 family protein [Jeotgalibacillus sp. S-D1]|uniref:YybH family protein n=1 Tax=Jeotgalibacillus sp. S-D1 TaxID=2552189 RepID=UPI001404438A|nr:nuclear transport factor 2 family protein [Jeotgalibacillus sp. S-D1]